MNDYYSYIAAQMTERERAEYFGYDTPEQIASEMQARNEEDWIEEQDAIESRGGPVFYPTCFGLEEIPY